MLQDNHLDCCFQNEEVIVKKNASLIHNLYEFKQEAHMTKWF